MSVRKEIYNKVSAELKTLDFMQWIDLFKGQMTNKNDSYPTGFPSAFISIGRINYEDMTMGIKEGKLILDIYVFFNKGGDTFVDAEDKDTSLEILDQTDTIVETLEGLQGDFFTEINQSGEEDLTERYQRPAYKLSFDTLIYKRINKPDYVLN